MAPRKQTDAAIAAALRKQARAYDKAVLQALAEVATTGTSEASRVSAATALLDRGHGKTPAAAVIGSVAPAPVIYQRIELIDGIRKGFDADHQAADDKDRIAAAAAPGIQRDG